MSVSWGKMLDDLSEESIVSAGGFSQVQVPVGAIMNLDADRFTSSKKLLHEHGIVPAVCSSPLPADVQVTEMGFNIYVWTEYLKKAARRLADLGCRQLAWNNGRARVLPWEGDIVGVKEQVLQFLFLLCDVAAEHGIDVLVEPLGPLRTNFLNTMEEVQEFLLRVGKENLASMVSFRELHEIRLDPSDLASFRELVRFVQLENPQASQSSRVSPRPGDGIDYLPFLRALRKSAYSGMICLPQDADRATLALCQRLWDDARSSASA